MSGLVLLTVAGAVPEWRTLEFQRYAAPASRFNRPAMPVGHPKVRAFYAIAASVAGMGVHAPVARVSAAHPGGAGHCSPHPHRPPIIPRVRWRLPGLRVVCTSFVRTASRESLAASVAGMGVRPRSPGKRRAPGKCRAPQRVSTLPSAHSPGALALTRATRRVYLLRPDGKRRVACRQHCRSGRSPPVARKSAAHPGSAGHCSAYPHCPALIPRVRWRLPGLRVVCTSFVRTASGESLAASIVGVGVRPR